jgi:hypothetical protein
VKQRADELDLMIAEEFFEKSRELRHIRVRRRADLLTLESGDRQDPLPHARLRRLSSQSWRLEMPTHTGRWEPTPYRDDLFELLKTLRAEFAWTLAPVDPE